MDNTGSVIVETRKNPGCLLQILWFAFIGIWLGQAWMIVAWIFMITIIGIPLGVAMVNMLPKVIALREPSHKVVVRSTVNGELLQRDLETRQLNLFLRAIYFLLVGWWLSAIWMELAYAISLTIIGLPVGFWMFDRVPQVLSLKR